MALAALKVPFPTELTGAHRAAILVMYMDPDVARGLMSSLSTEEIREIGLAMAEMERFARQFCHGSCSVRGDSSVRAGSMVDFSGLPKGQNGKFYVIATRHIISVRTGYTTELTFCSNTSGS